MTTPGAWQRAAARGALLRVAAVELLHARVSPKTVWSFVRIRAADGLTGVGEASLMRDPQALAAAFATLTRDSAHSSIGGLRASSLAARRPTLAEAAIASAIEQACWDLAARAAGVDVASLIGPGAHANVPLYANINRRTLRRSPAEVALSAREAAAAGYSRFKFAPFDDLTPGAADTAAGRVLFDTGIARIAAMRESLGPDAEIFVDCHWRFTPAEARRAIEALAPLGVTWFECPLPEDQSTIGEVVALRAAANARGMRLAGLEALPSQRAFKPWLEAGAYDVVMPDVKYCGGIESLLAIGAAAAAHGAACAPHNPSGPVSHVASLAAAAHLPLPVLLEHQWDETPWFYAIGGEGVPRPSAGASALPPGPGFGVLLGLGASRVELQAFPRTD